MVHRRNLPRFAAGLLLLPLAACSSLGGVFRGDDAIEVAEVRRLASCNTQGPQARVSLLPGSEAVRTWQAARGVELIGVDPLPAAGAYVLVEMGQRPSAGYGILVSRQAVLGSGSLRLSASQITPAPGEPMAEVVTSPCALVALPQGIYSRVELRDPAGGLLARADGAAPVQ